jgi:hypothetical protein
VSGKSGWETAPKAKVTIYKIFSFEMNVIKVSIVGDVMTGGILSSGIEGYRDILLSDKVRKLLEADIVFCNLECVLTRAEAPPEKNKILLHAKEESVELLKNAGFNAVSLANNHIMDFGYNSLLGTIKLLKENNIGYTGAGKNLYEARKPVFFDKDDLRIALLAYVAPETWGGWGQREQQTHKDWVAGVDKPGVAPFDLNLIKEDLDLANKEADFLIVSIHWGDEYTYFPHPDIISDAHRIIDMGANLVVGGHPHVLQGYEEYHNGLIMYSLSNFLFPPYYDENDGELRKWSRKSRESVILKCEISRNGILSYELIPVMQKGDEPAVISVSHKTANKILSKIESLSKEYKKANYHVLYARLKEKEDRFKYIKLVWEMYEIYGLAYICKKVRAKLLKMLKDAYRRSRVEIWENGLEKQK